MTLQPPAARQRRSPLRTVATSPAALSVVPAAAGAPLGPMAARSGRYLAAADPATALRPTERGIEDRTAAKAQVVYRMVSDVRSRGVPIDRVVLRAHVGGSGPPGTVQTTLASVAASGVDVRITELDIAAIPLATRLAGSAVGEPQREARSRRTPAAAR